MARSVMARFRHRLLLLVAGALLLVDLALLFVRPPGGAPAQEGSPRVGLVFDIGGLGDKSFNDGAYAGLLAARASLGAGIAYLEPGDGSDREAAIRLLAAQRSDLVIGVGFMFTDDLRRVSSDYPEVSFAGIDFALATDSEGRPLPLPQNLVALRFREEEGSFLVGALAGLVSRTRKLGFVGGMDIPLIHKFEAGYAAGVAAVCPECEVLTAYAGVTPVAFKDPGKGKELALAQYSSGADIIFHASGSTGLGVFEAARERRALAIGVDADQAAEAPGHILTSMVKRVDRAVLEAARRVQDGSFAGGVVTLGVAEGGVDYVYDHNNEHLIPPAVRNRVEALRAELVAGRIHLPETRVRP